MDVMSGDEYVDFGEIWKAGSIEWIRQHKQTGWWTPYYVNFMFEAFQGPEQTVTAEMHRALYRFYGRFSTRFDRDAKSDRAKAHIPRFWLFPDKPAYKGRRNTPVREIKINANGKHFNGFMLLPLTSYFKGDPIRYLRDNSFYGIQGIDIKKVYDEVGISSYALKTIRWGGANESDILILPRPASELSTKGRPKFQGTSSEN